MKQGDADPGRGPVQKESEMQVSDNVISLSEVHKTYEMGGEDVHALQGLSLDIRRGEFVAVMGPSGSGKSTLMNIVGLLDRPSSGEYTLDGQAVSGFSKGKQAEIRNQRIGFVFQQFNLLPRTTVLDNVLLPTIYSSVGGGRQRARELLDMVGLAEYESHKSNQISGGQMQRVAIARALIMEPSIILADEPTGNLDSRKSREIMELFEKINDEGATVVLITHEEDIAGYADRTVRLLDGRVVDDESGDHRWGS